MPSTRRTGTSHCLEKERHCGTEQYKCQISADHYWRKQLQLRGEEAGWFWQERNQSCYGKWVLVTKFVPKLIRPKGKTYRKFANFESPAGKMRKSQSFFFATEWRTLKVYWPYNIFRSLPWNSIRFAQANQRQRKAPLTFSEQHDIENVSSC